MSRTPHINSVSPDLTELASSVAESRVTSHELRCARTRRLPTIIRSVHDSRHARFIGDIVRLFPSPYPYASLTNILPPPNALSRPVVQTPHKCEQLTPIDHAPRGTASTHLAFPRITQLTPSHLAVSTTHVIDATSKNDRQTLR